MDTAVATNAPRTLSLAGRDFQVSALALRDWGRVQAWIKDKVPGPLAVLGTREYQQLPESARREVRLDAVARQQKWPPHPGTLEWSETIDCVEGGDALFVHVVLSKHQAVTEDEARQIANAMTSADAANLFSLAFLGELPAPKAEPGTEAS